MIALFATTPVVLTGMVMSAQKLVSLLPPVIFSAADSAPLSLLFAIKSSDHGQEEAERFAPSRP